MADSITEIDYELCNGCRRCYDLCPEDVYVWDDRENSARVAYPEECWGCGVCWGECPRRAISYVIPASLW